MLTEEQIRECLLPLCKQDPGAVEIMLECSMDEYRAIEQAVRKVLTRPAVPEGWKLVPIEPTEEMWMAGDESIGKWGVDASGSCVYRAMLAAAPQPEEGTLT